MGTTDDIPTSFFVDVWRIAGDLRCDARDLLRPLYNESGLSYKAHNPTGNAAGIFQAMPATLVALGFVGGWQAFCALNDDEQLPWLEKYYRPYAGQLVNATAVYMTTFCPAWLAHARAPSWRICARDGFSYDSPLSKAESQIWYRQNSGLDMNRDGVITVSDLTNAITAADRGARWAEVLYRLEAAKDEAMPDTTRTPPVDGAPLPEAETDAVGHR